MTRQFLKESNFNLFCETFYNIWIVTKLDSYKIGLKKRLRRGYFYEYKEAHADGSCNKAHWGCAGEEVLHFLFQACSYKSVYTSLDKRCLKCEAGNNKNSVWLGFWHPSRNNSIKCLLENFTEEDSEYVSYVWDFGFSRRRVWRWLSSGMLRRVV
jgi:hypothetical protein